MLKQFSFLIFSVLFWTVIPFQINAQTIDGRVTDACTGEPLEGATVLESETTNGTSTEPDGSFELELTTDIREIVVSFVGYESQTMSITDPDKFMDIALEESIIMSGEIFVSALRVDESTPIAYSNITRKEIETKNLGQDIPMLIQSSPSVVSTSDAGAGIGYTGVRIRGVDPARINVTINGIPLNDAESHGVFWVDLPDLASSTQNIQIQRGVGTSTQGAGAFGATMNLQTALMNPSAYGEITTGIGSYGTRKANVQLGSGLIDNGWQFEGRLSKIESNGYIDRAHSDLRSFYLSGARHGDRSLLKADIFSGKEETYQAWNGVPEPIIENDSQQLESYISNLFLGQEEAEHWRKNLGNRQFNQFTYDDQTDNYQQDHYQLHYSYRFTDTWLANASLHYTYGRGYYEEYRRDDDLATYNINPIQIGGESIISSDLVRRRWLNNHFYGGVFSTEWKRPENWTLTIGGGYNEYDGDHFGEVIWARFAGNSNIGDQYYDNTGFKTDFNIYGKLNYYLASQFNAFADLQYRTVGYEFLGLRIDDQSEDIVDVTQKDRINFLNPKFGVVYRPSNGHRMFASLSVGGKEPTRDEYVESTEESRPDPERLYDYEFGYNGLFQNFEIGLNLYYMKYIDQLILTGEVNDVGAYIRQNVPDSYRAGIELQFGTRLLPDLDWSANATFSRNKIDEYQRFVDDFDQGAQQSETYTDVDIAFSPSTITNSILSYNPGQFTAEWILKYVSRQYLDNTQNETRSIDPYLLNDLRFSYELDDLSFVKNVTATLQINNVLDEKYSSNGYTFGWIAGGEEQFFNYYYPQAGRNVLMNVRIRF